MWGPGWGREVNFFSNHSKLSLPPNCKLCSGKSVVPGSPMCCQIQPWLWLTCQGTTHLTLTLFTLATLLPRSLSFLMLMVRSPARTEGNDGTKTLLCWHNSAATAGGGCLYFLYTGRGCEWEAENLSRGARSRGGSERLRDGIASKPRLQAPHACSIVLWTSLTKRYNYSRISRG